MQIEIMKISSKVFFIYQSQTSTSLTQGTCGNIGGYFVPFHNTSDSTSTTEATVTEDQCYYDTFDCAGYSYRGQCYSNKSSETSCPSCNNIGGVYSTIYDCYYYADDCRYLSVGQECHTDRCCNRVIIIIPPPIGERSVAMSVSVCLCVCPRSYLRNYTSDLHQNFVAYYL